MLHASFISQIWHFLISGHKWVHAGTPGHPLAVAFGNPVVEDLLVGVGKVVDQLDGVVELSDVSLSKPLVMWTLYEVRACRLFDSDDIYWELTTISNIECCMSGAALKPHLNWGPNSGQ
jgi:hypothetical protein